MSASLREGERVSRPSSTMIRTWISALAGPRAVPSRLLEDLYESGGRAIGPVTLPGRISPHATRASAVAITTAVGDVQLVSACGPSGAWRLESEGDSSVLVVVALTGRMRVRRNDQVAIVGPGGVCFVTDDRPVVLDGIDESGSALIALVPASRMLALHRELSTRGLLTAADTPHLRAALAYLGTMLVSTACEDRALVGEQDDVAIALAASLVEQALTAAGRSTRTVEVRRAALRSIERHHRAADFGVDDIARELFLSRRQLYRAFPDAGGIAAIIAQRRLQSAERIMLERPHLQLGEVASLSGFSTPGVMRAHFRRAYGTTPQKHRDTTAKQRTAAGLAAGGVSAIE